VVLARAVEQTAVNDEAADTATTKGANNMEVALVLESFGQQVPTLDRLSPMARAIPSGIGDGRSAAWAGFVWYEASYELSLDVVGRIEPADEAQPQAA
jgi:hypothetical protein